jgi:hypothetical protein
MGTFIVRGAAKQHEFLRVNSARGLRREGSGSLTLAVMKLLVRQHVSGLRELGYRATMSSVTGWGYRATMNLAAVSFQS